jgi:cell division inhibitor SulA
MPGAGKLHHLNAWENRTSRYASRVIPTGISVLDDMLPDGGWPRAGVVEVAASTDGPDAIDLFLPALARMTRQGRRLALVAPEFAARQRVFSDEAINPDRVLQVNSHPGRSDLWTVESLLQSGDFGVVIAWSGCHTELMDKRLQKAAMQGKVLCIVFRPRCRRCAASVISIRLGVDVDEAGRVVYLVNGKGDSVAGAVWD